MASGSTYIIEAGSNYSCVFSLSCYEKSGSVDIAKNTSVVHADWSATYNSNYSFYGGTRNTAGYLRISVDGQQNGIDIPLPSGTYNGQTLGSGSADFTVAHNEDGSRSITVGIAMDQGGGNYSGDTWVWAGTEWSNATLSLTTIPRTSNVSLNKSTATLNGSDGFVIYTNRASSSFSHNIYQNISGSWVQIAGGVGDNYTWIPSTNFYENIGNSSKTYQILCQTWSGGTHIGDSQVNFTLASAGVHQCSLSTSSITLNGSNSVRIYTNRSCGSFRHHIEQNFSGSMAELCSGYSVTDYLDWAPPVDWYNAIGGGSKSFTIRVHCANNSGKYLGFTDVSFTIYSAGADSVSLNNTNMTMGTTYTVSIAKRVSNFRHTVTWSFKSASGQLGTDKAVDTSVGWTPSKDLSVQIPTAMTGQGTITCQTYYKDTPIGSTSVAFNLSVPSYNVVLGTPAITETGKDNTGTALTEKGIGATEVVAIMSIKRLVVSATTSHNATIKTISVSFGGSTKTASSGSFDDTFSGMMNGNLTITATDSRGRALASTYSQSYTFRDYFKPSVTSFDGDREPQTGDTGTLKAAGTFWNKTAGTTANVLAGAISISATGATTIVPTENKWTTAFDVSGVNYQNSYNFKIIVTDSFGFTAEKTYTLNASEPVLVKLKHTVRIYRNLVVSNIIKATKGYFTGDLKVGGKIIVGGVDLKTPYPNAGSHNLYRGKYLGTAVTDAQYTEISNGTFTDLFVGDYWTIGGVNWVIAGFDYYANCGDNAVLGHHAVIVPATNLYSAKMNNSNVTTGAYVGSAMYTTNLASAKTTISGIFGTHLKTHRILLQNAMSNGYPSGGIWADSTVDLMSEVMVYGTHHFSSMADGTTIPYEYACEDSQLPLMAQNKALIHTRQDYWLRDAVSAATFAFVNSGGLCYLYSASYSLGVRPAFCIS